MKATSGAVLGVAVILAIARTWIRVRRFHRLYLDDGFLFFAAATLISGTGLLLAHAPYEFTQDEVQAGIESPSESFIEAMLADQRTQSAGVVLLTATIFNVKLSFLFFFRLLLQRAKWWYIWWWWTVLAILIPSAMIMIFSCFISCPYTTVEMFSPFNPFPPCDDSRTY